MYTTMTLLNIMIVNQCTDFVNGYNKLLQLVNVLCDIAVRSEFP